MEILTYPVGVLVGMLTVAVDLGNTPPPAQLLLDGKPVCTLAEKQASCPVDLGAAPHPHLLEAVKTDAAGRVTQRATRGVNIPGEASAEVRLFPECSKEKKTCAVRFGWIHPSKKPPVSVRLAVDGVEQTISKDGKVDIPFDAERGHVVSVDVDFGNDDRVVHSDVVGPTRKAEVSAALRAYPILTDGEPADLEKRLRERGLVIQAVERGQAEVLFVVEQKAVGALDSMSSKRTAFLSQRLSTPEMITVVSANQPQGTTFPRLRARDEGSNAALQKAEISVQATGAQTRGATAGSASTAAEAEKSDWFLALLAQLRGRGKEGPRATDATAASGFALGAAPRRRALVLVLGDQPDESKLTADGVRAYLAEIGVPLAVWRTGPARPAWPDAIALANSAEMARALSDVRTLLTRQMVVWAPPETTLAALTAAVSPAPASAPAAPAATPAAAPTVSQSAMATP